MNVVARVAVSAARRAYDCYRYYFYWRAQEKMYRRWSSEQLKAAQWEKFRRLLGFAYERIPFYQDKFSKAGVTPEGIRTPEDLLRIPVLTKDEIRQNFPDRLVEGNRRFHPFQIGQTSGSTGESLHFVRPETGWHRTIGYSVLLRTGRVANIPVVSLTTPQCTAASCSLHDQEGAHGVGLGKCQKVWFLRHLDQVVELPSSESILCAPSRYMEQLVGVISYLAPCILYGDPVYLGSLALYLKKARKPIPEVRCIVTSFELLTGSLRDRLRDVFGCDVYTQYGASEVSDIANECEHHRLHVRANIVMVEAIRHGVPAKPGEIGRAVVTDLENYNMPLIRYDIGDLIEVGNGPCPCGRNTDVIEQVHGRARDVITPAGADKGRALTPLQVDEVFRGLGGIAAYRLVQRSENQYDITIMRDGLPDNFDSRTLEGRCRAMFGQGSHFNITSVDEIKPERSKKYRFVYSQVSAGAV
jgi:phenylacetate-CoA ligase